MMNHGLIRTFEMYILFIENNLAKMQLIQHFLPMNKLQCCQYKKQLEDLKKKYPKKNYLLRTQIQKNLGSKCV